MELSTRTPERESGRWRVVVRACAFACACAGVRVCARARACVRVGVRVCACVRARACVGAVPQAARPEGVGLHGSRRWVLRQAWTAVPPGCQQSGWQRSEANRGSGSKGQVSGMRVGNTLLWIRGTCSGNRARGRPHSSAQRSQLPRGRPVPGFHRKALPPPSPAWPATSATYLRLVRQSAQWVRIRRYRTYKATRQHAECSTHVGVLVCEYDCGAHSWLAQQPS